MRSSVKCCVLILAATTVAVALRLPEPARRPMHGDEAVHADKFADLLEGAGYEYDPNEYHGPTLNYFTLIPAWLTSVKTYAQTTEFTVRIVPVFFGVLLVVGILLVMDGLGGWACACAALLTATSPAMVFYSRYYIQEMLLVCFTFAAIAFGYRFAQRRRIIWAVLTGVSLGLMHATKETCIIAFGSMLVALWITLHLRKQAGQAGVKEALGRIKPSHFVVIIASGLIVSALFYSSFLSNPRGIWDSFATYATYFDRAGNNHIHEHPWYYYLKMLIYSRFGGGPVWSEAAIVLLAVVGVGAVLTKRGLGAANIDLLRFLVFYTLCMVVLYSLIRYKTPWCMLGFLHGMILLAGVGAVVLVRAASNVLPRLIVICLLLECSLHLLWQAYAGSYKYEADSKNPYVYAHPTPEVFEIADRVREYVQTYKTAYELNKAVADSSLSGYSPSELEAIREELERYALLLKGGPELKIQVICTGNDYWPLPWYLRRLDQDAIAWRARLDAVERLAPMVVISPEFEGAMSEMIYDERIPLEEIQMYRPIFEPPYYMWLRPAVKIKGFARNDLWELHQGRDELDDWLGRDSTPPKPSFSAKSNVLEDRLRRDRTK